MTTSERAGNLRSLFLWQWRVLWNPHAAVSSPSAPPGVAFVQAAFVLVMLAMLAYAPFGGKW